MGNIAAGQQFGHGVAEDRWNRGPSAGRSVVLDDGAMRLAGVLDAQGREMEAAGRAQQDAADKARAMRLSSEAEFGLLEAHTGIAEQLRAGKLNPAEALDQFRQRAKQIAEANLDGVPDSQRLVAGEVMQTRVRRFEIKLGETLQQHRRDTLRADVAQTLQNLAAMGSTDRPGAVATAQTVLDNIGAEAGFGPDDKQRLLADFRLQAAQNEAALALFEARGSAAAIDAVEARINSDEFNDLTPQARLHLRQQAQARKEHLVHEADAAANRAAAVQNAEELKLYGTAQLQVEQTGRIDSELWAQLKDGHRAALLNRQKAEAKARAAEAAGKPVKTDWPLYLDLREAALNDPAKFAQLDLKQYVDRIGGAQLEQLADLKGKKILELGKAPRDAVSLQQQMTATMQSLRITGKTERGRFLSYVQSEVDAATQAKGKPLGFAERQQIIDAAVLQGPDPDAWLFGTKRAFELTAEQRTRFKPVAPADAPATEVDALNEALAQQGLPQTPANRLRLYQRAMKAPQ